MYNLEDVQDVEYEVDGLHVYGYGSGITFAGGVAPISVAVSKLFEALRIPGSRRRGLKGRGYLFPEKGGFRGAQLL